MANHVHVLLTPHVEMKKVTRAIKSYSARKANQILGRTGEPFWQDESYDHWIREDEEMNRIIRYIEWNPVKARLVERIEDWPWSSASRQFQAWQAISLPHQQMKKLQPQAISLRHVKPGKFRIKNVKIPPRSTTQEPPSASGLFEGSHTWRK